MSIFPCVCFITVFVALSYRDDGCKKHSFFLTGVVVILWSIYSLARPCVSKLESRINRVPTSDIIFEVGEEEGVDGIPLPPDPNSGIKIDTMHMSKIWSGTVPGTLIQD
jgi:hypothetical protein